MGRVAKTYIDVAQPLSGRVLGCKADKYMLMYQSAYACLNGCRRCMSCLGVYIRMVSSKAVRFAHSHNLIKAIGKH